MNVALTVASSIVSHGTSLTGLAQTSGDNESLLSSEAFEAALSAIRLAESLPLSCLHGQDAEPEKSLGLFFNTADRD